MIRFRDISIRRKLLLINMLTTSTALLLASGAFITYERIRFHEDVTRQLSTVADVIGTNSRAALLSRDKAAATEVLRGVSAEPRILAACIYQVNAQALACYARDPGADDVFPTAIPAAGIRSLNGDLLLSRSIESRNKTLGTLWIRFDSRVSFEALRHDMAMVSLAMAVCFIFAVLLSSKLQRAISAPVLHLAETAKEVAMSSNYSIRAVKYGDDELGRLIDSFNEMLSRLGEHAAEVRSIYDSAMDAIVTVDSAGKITTWNHGAERMFGRREADVLGDSLLEFIAGQSRQVYAEELDRLRSVDNPEQCPKLIEIAGTRADAGEFPLELSLVQWSTKRGTFYTSFMRDTSERRLLESQLVQAQKLESIGHLAAGVAHEINTPIQYIGDNTKFLEDSFRSLDRVLRGYEAMLQKAESSGVLEQTVKEMRVSAEEADLEYLHTEIPRAIQQSSEGVERVATIVRAMKEFSHPGGVEMKAIDINHAIESTITVSRNEWKYVAETETHFDSLLPAVRCYPGEFNQVILNLVVNAAHAIADITRGIKKGRISISTRRDGVWAEIRISDTGTGIPAAVQNKIFTPFFTTKEVGRGTGQGLAIAHTVVVKKHGGTLDFETEEGKGTTFIIRLPIDGLAPAKT